jgi:hypothetical protein
VDLLSGSISHAVSPVAVRVLPDLRAGAGLGSSPVPQLWVDFVRLPGIRTPPDTISCPTIKVREARTREAVPDYWAQPDSL